MFVVVRDDLFAGCVALAIVAALVIWGVVTLFVLEILGNDSGFSEPFRFIRQLFATAMEIIIRAAGLAELSGSWLN
jgi:hypothetical protein